MNTGPARGTTSLSELCMKYEMRRYSYKCRCGYLVTVFVDCGVPQEKLRCRKCAGDMSRSEG